MSTQIRAPKAKKINSYLLSRTPVNQSNFTHNAMETEKIKETFASLEKRNSEVNLIKYKGEEEKVCFESIESDIYDQLRKNSVLKEINEIVNKPRSFDNTQNYTKQKILRCENPFSKNFLCESECSTKNSERTD